MAQSYTTILGENLLATTAQIHFVLKDGVYGGPYIQITFESGIIHRYVLTESEMNACWNWADDYFYEQAQPGILIEEARQSVQAGKYSFNDFYMEAHPLQSYDWVHWQHEGGFNRLGWDYRYSMGFGYMWDVFMVYPWEHDEGKDWYYGPADDYHHGGKGMPAHYPVPSTIGQIEFDPHGAWIEDISNEAYYFYGRKDNADHDPR